jgi:uncharacterized membrane protein (DUF4010 family)
LLGVAVVTSLVTWLLHLGAASKPASFSNPTELKGAIAFGLLYAVVTVAVAAARRHFDASGLYVIAAISGLTDMDAITLSTSRMVVNEGLAAAIAWRAIVIASMANLMFKLMIVAALGGRPLLGRVWWLMAIQLAAGGLLLALWPDHWAAAPPVP